MSEGNNDKSGDDLQARITQAVPVVRSFLETVLGMMGVEVEVDIRGKRGESRQREVQRLAGQVLAAPADPQRCAAFSSTRDWGHGCR